MHLGAIPQHPTCEEGVVGIRFEGENSIGDVGEGVGEEPNVCTDVDGNPAARYQFGKDRELRLTRACLLRNVNTAAASVHISRRNCGSELLRCEPTHVAALDQLIQVLARLGEVGRHLRTCILVSPLPVANEIVYSAPGI